MKQAVNFRLESEKIAALDRLAQSLDRDRSYLLSEAVDSKFRKVSERPMQESLSIMTSLCNACARRCRGVAKQDEDSLDP